MEFSKYQGTGNDFVMVLDLDDERPLKPDEVAALCDRRTGVGADGVIRVVRTDRDGAPLLHGLRQRRRQHRRDVRQRHPMRRRAACTIGASPTSVEFDVLTRAGVKHLALHDDAGGRVDRVTVGMGAPNFTKAAIPMRGPAWETFLQQPFEVGRGLTVTASAVSMGNPHLVLFLDEDPDRFHVAHIGPALERHELFPEHTNVEFAQVGADGIKVRVWERGSGETMACGSGACAVAVAANEAGLVPERVTIGFPGGELEVERRDDGEVLLTGAAEHVFDGTIDLERPTVVSGDHGGRPRRPARRAHARPGRHPVGEPRRSGGRSRAIRRRDPLGVVRGPRRGRLRAVRSARRCAGSDAPFVVLAGHVDTVPLAGGDRARRPGTATAVVGRGAADMKAGLAVMLELGRPPSLVSRPRATSTSGSCSSAGRSSRSRESALLPLFDRCAAAADRRSRDRDGTHRQRDRGGVPGQPERA